MASISKKPASRKAGGNALDAIASQIKALEKKRIANVIEIGRLLHEADEACEHGAYMVWLKAEFGWSHQTSLRYRSVYNLCQNPQIVDFTKLDISISAVYEVADLFRNFFGLPICQAAGEAIIEPAKVGRVTYSITRQIITDIKAEMAAQEPAHVPAPVAVAVPPATRTVEVEISHRSIPLTAPFTRLPGRTISPAKSTEQPDQTTLDRVKSVLDDAKQRKPAAPHSDYDDLARLLRHLHIRLYDSGTDLEMAVAEVGTVPIREIIGRLKSALDKHDATAALVAKADRAEAGRKTKLNKTTIQAMADAAEAKSKASSPAADEFPDIPPGLDRRSKPQTVEKVDQTAAEIAAEAHYRRRG